MKVTREDFKTFTVIVGSTLLLFLGHYHPLGENSWLSSIIYFLAVPLAIIVFIFREDPRRWGLAVGNWRQGLAYAAISIAFMAVVIALVSRLPDFRNYYQVPAFQDRERVPIYALQIALYMIGWEYLWRGFVMFGLGERFGRWAILLQAVPFAVAHLGKPELETLSTIFGGAAFGWIAWQSRAVWPTVLIHWSIFMLLMAAVNL